MAQDADVVCMDPNKCKLTTDHNINREIFSTLLPATNTDMGGVATAGVAESYEQTSPTAYTFHLRKNITFHDGSPLTSADVKFSLDRAMKSPVVKEHCRIYVRCEGCGRLHGNRQHESSLCTFHCSIFIEPHGDFAKGLY